MKKTNINFIFLKHFVSIAFPMWFIYDFYTNWKIIKNIIIEKK